MARTGAKDVWAMSGDTQSNIACSYASGVTISPLVTERL